MSVTLLSGRVVDVEEARRIFEVDPIIQQFGTWAVTEYGLECLTTHYAIEASRLREMDWARHMTGPSGNTGKTWIVADDFLDALAAAREHFQKPTRPTPTPPVKTGDAAKRERHRRRAGLSSRVRFLVLKRDSYRCQLCGISAVTSPTVELEIDHKTPLARGGSNHLENLWVLCRPCNQGKSAEEL